jgi:hypothetical protein
MKFLKQVWENRQFIAGMLLILFLVLFLRQCSETNKLKSELKVSKHIASQNIAALGDKEIQLKLTKEQLAVVDTKLSNALNRIDSLKNIKSKTITITQPIYVNKNVVVPSEFVYDTLNSRYGLSFNSKDLVRTIKGISWFKIDNTKETLRVLPNSTNISDFKLNFALVISQYDDEVTKYTRTKIVPFNVKDNGELGEEIPESLLKISFRNAEILDKPFEPKKPDNPVVKPKTFNTGLGLSISPLAIGLVPSANGVVRVAWTPNIGLSYCITFRKK